MADRAEPGPRGCGTAEADGDRIGADLAGWPIAAEMSLRHRRGTLRMLARLVLFLDPNPSPFIGIGKPRTLATTVLAERRPTARRRRAGLGPRLRQAGRPTGLLPVAQGFGPGARAPGRLPGAPPLRPGVRPRRQGAGGPTFAPSTSRSGSAPGAGRIRGAFPGQSAFAAFRRAIRSSRGWIADITAAKTTTAQLTERTRRAPTSSRAGREFGVIAV